MLTVTQNMMLPTAITGSYPRPLWFDMSLNGRSFKSALGESLFREQYMDAVAAADVREGRSGSGRCFSETDYSLGRHSP